MLPRCEMMLLQLALEIKSPNVVAMYTFWGTLSFSPQEFLDY